MRKFHRICIGILCFTGLLQSVRASDIMPPLPVEIWNIFPDIAALREFVDLNVINPTTFYSILVVDLIIIVPAFLLHLRMRKSDTLVPDKLQSFFEFIVESFDGLVKDSMGVEKGAQYLPFIGTLFIFIFLSNIIGLIPIREFTVAGFWFPGLAEPTQDYNIAFGLALLFVILMGHGSVIYYKGVSG